MLIWCWFIRTGDKEQLARLGSFDNGRDDKWMDDMTGSNKRNMSSPAVHHISKIVGWIRTWLVATTTSHYLNGNGIELHYESKEA
jgi:hypothetical protein